MFLRRLASDGPSFMSRQKRPVFARGRGRLHPYLQQGSVKVTVVSQTERSYPHASLDWRLIGEESISAVAGLRLVTATAITPLALL
jgi:hypothetical protein